jgi:DNA-directed RNA polymerase specialized sigma24 family protein
VDRDAEPDLPVPERPTILEDLLQLKQEELMLSEALARLSPQYRRLIEMLSLETLHRAYTEVAADSGLEPGSTGFLWQKCLQHPRWRLAEPGFR